MPAGCPGPAGERYVSSASGEFAETIFRQTNLSPPIPESQVLEAEPLTGRTHQIRVHLAAIGHSIVGDFLYDQEGSESFGLKRHFLHAHSLEFFHPRDHRVVTIESELPSELKAVARHLRSTR